LSGESIDTRLSRATRTRSHAILPISTDRHRFWRVLRPEESTSAVGYLVNHTATLIVVDKDGELKFILRFDLTEERVAADLAPFVG
jgi:cytochrome oxidase Cu insertion factor (SCO1/SenC/PrrC family)